jgi:hypothetical protein
MGTKRTSSEGAVGKTAKLPPKRKVVVRPAAVDSALKSKSRPPAAAPQSESPMPPHSTTPGLPKGTQLAPEVIALRAYFISEQRHAEGREGDSLSDWLEAERQLLAENQP